MQFGKEWHSPKNTSRFLANVKKSGKTPEIFNSDLIPNIYVGSKYRTFMAIETSK